MSHTTDAPHRTATAPSLLGLTPSFGFGDRLGCATPGHLDALRDAGGPIRGIFAQQSIREMNRTRRSPTEVMRCAADALTRAGYSEPWGADADHIKRTEDVDVTLDAGFVFFTLDPSEFVDQKADGYTPDEVEQRFATLGDVAPWVKRYEDQTVTLPDGGRITLDGLTVRRAAVKYGRAIDCALNLAQYARSAAKERGVEIELELSVDETEQPTSPAEHYIIADQFRSQGVPLVSLAPRFIGDFEKGVDYRGDLDALERSLRTHAAIARACGPYKLSLHSGSDKLSMYPILARATEGMFHVKTAGTSYLEALRVLARLAPDQFRRIIVFSRERYEQDRATYHVSAELTRVPAPEDIASDAEREAVYLERWDDVPAGRGFTAPGRQILHCTFGSVLTDAELGPLVHRVLREHADEYRRCLAEHFTRHLRALSRG